jgi:hypothetical protein
VRKHYAITQKRKVMLLGLTFEFNHIIFRHI